MNFLAVLNVRQHVATLRELERFRFRIESRLMPIGMGTSYNPKIF
jgi:hypothetical protein